MGKIVRLNEQELRQIILRLIKEGDEEENSYDSCDFSSSKESASSKWNNISDATKKSLLDKIKNDSFSQISKAVREYKNWFSNSATQKKFKPNELKIVNSSLGPYLDKITNVNLTFNPPRPTVIAWVNSKKTNIINLTVPMIHNTQKYIGPSLYETIKHEIGHLIDYFFKANGIRTYYDTVDTDTQQEYQDNYAINDRDQYTRLNVFRTYVGAGPNDHPSLLLKKFLTKVEEGIITSKKWDFKGITASKGTNKNSNDEAEQINKFLFSTIYYNGKHSLNIEQLFATFAFMKGSDIYVNFDLIANLNVTSKDANRKYYYLKLSQK